jgi:hypothetical protein
MINTLLDWLEDKLETITTIEHIYKYSTDNPEGYPYAEIIFETTDAEWVSTATSWRTYNFKIRLVYDIRSGTLELDAVDKNLYDLVDEVVDMLEINRTAGGNADLMEPSSGRCGWLDENRQLRYNDVSISFRATRTAG